MIQTGLIQNAHGDLITDASYDFYGLRLASCGLDHRIKIWQLDENNSWSVEDDWKAHDAAVSSLSWAHPEFGSIIASASFDRTVKIWEQASMSLLDAPSGHGSYNSRWVERQLFSEAKGTVRAVEFAPRHFGLKLATISTDNTLRTYECSEQHTLINWHVTDEVDVHTMAPGPSPAYLSRVNTAALSTPTQTNATLEGASASLVAQALQQNMQQPNATTGRPGNREADGGWCLSWCKDRYWGEVIAAGCGTSGIVKIIHLNSRRSTLLLSLSSSSNTASNSSPSTNSAAPSENAAEGRQGPAPTNGSASTTAITTVSWAPSCGRSYHLIATGGRDGHVRIWKVKPGSDDVDPEHAGDSDGEDGRWTGVVVADFEHHKSAVTRVQWNITGTILSSAGNDGRVRLWKATSGSVWRPAGSVSVEQSDEPSLLESKDVEMDA